MPVMFQRLTLICALICVPLVSFFATLWLIDNVSVAPDLLKKAGQTDVSQWKRAGQATFSTDKSGTVTMTGPDHIYQEFICKSQCEAELSIYVIRSDRIIIGVLFLNDKRELLQNMTMPIGNIENKTMSFKKSISANAAFAHIYVYAEGKTDTISFKDAKMSVR